MHILYLVHQFYPQTFAGTEKFLLRLAQGCQAAGHAVTIVTYDLPARKVAPYHQFVRAAGRPILRRLSEWGVPIYQWLPHRHAAQPATRYRVRPHRYTYQGLPVIAYRRHPASSAPAVAGDPLLPDFVAEILREIQPDLIHAAHVMRVEDFLHAAVEQGVPYLLTLTDFWLICPNCRLQTARDERCWGPQGGRACRTSCPNFHPADIAERLQRAGRLLRSSRAIAAPTRFLAERIQAEHGSLPIQIIPYGTESPPQPATRQRSLRPLVFGFAGGLYAAKGAHLLIAAFRRLAAPDVRLAIYGGGRLAPKLRRQASGDTRIHFGGVYAPEELSALLSQIDVMVVPSIWHENAPLVMLEALAHGVPVLVSDVAGMTECVTDGVNGYTFQVGDVADLGRKLQMIYDHPERLDEIRENIRLPRAGQYRVMPLAETVDAYIRLYHQVQASLVGNQVTCRDDAPR